MDLNFTEEQLMLQDAARRIAQDVIAPSAEHFDRSGEFPLDNIRLLGESGLMGIEVPAEYGGAGMDPVSYVLAMVEIAHADAALYQAKHQGRNRCVAHAEGGDAAGMLSKI